MAIKRQMDPETHYPIIINALLHPLLFVVYSFLMTSQLDRCSTPATPFPYAYQGQRQRGAGGNGHFPCPLPCPVPQWIMARIKGCFHFSAILKKLGGYTLLQKKTCPSPQYKNANEGPVPYPTYAKRGARKVMERNFHHPSLPSSVIQHTLSCFLKVLYFQEYNGIVLNSGSLLKF